MSDFDPRNDWTKTWTEDKIKATWDKKRAEEIWTLDPAYHKVAAAVASLGESVLDVGCGGGIQYAAFQVFTPDLDYQGIDVHPGMIAYARQAFPGGRFDEGEASCLKYATSAYDVVLLRHVIEHHPPDYAVWILAEAKRVARRGLVILFFKPPHIGFVNRVRRRRVYVTQFSREWLMETLGQGADKMTVSRDFIARTPAALNDQELWTIDLF